MKQVLQTLSENVSTMRDPTTANQASEASEPNGGPPKMRGELGRRGTIRNSSHIDRREAPSDKRGPPEQGNLRISQTFPGIRNSIVHSRDPSISSNNSNQDHSQSSGTIPKSASKRRSQLPANSDSLNTSFVPSSDQTRTPANDDKGKKEEATPKIGKKCELKKGKQKLRKFEISGPSEFCHVQHFGLSATDGSLAVSVEVFFDYFHTHNKLYW